MEGQDLLAARTVCRSAAAGAFLAGSNVFHPDGVRPGVNSLCFYAISESPNDPIWLEIALAGEAAPERDHFGRAPFGRADPAAQLAPIPAREPEIRHLLRCLVDREALRRCRDRRRLRHREHGEEGGKGQSHRVSATSTPAAARATASACSFSTSGRIIFSITAGRIGPICRWAITPSAPTTKVSGTP